MMIVVSLSTTNIILNPSTDFDNFYLHAKYFYYHLTDLEKKS